MNNILKTVIALALASTAGLVHAQNNMDVVNGTKLPGIWDCTATLPVSASGSTTVIKGRANYNANGTVVHEDVVTKLTPGAAPVSIKVLAFADWKFVPASKLMYETTRKVSTTFDKTDSAAALMGVSMDKSYQSAVDREQATQVVRLDDNEWTTLAGDAKNPIAISCQRAKN
ncbi:hypothetical protein [Hydromonas duriensis]|uniref:Uncharacterized protein n=1 Tax=Hydromonas duriensis TaxID=1527608 RepID=A0A4R6Y7T1_9BURK|nr:hypothetical protein [Hydromonas duriensis]TDR31424.1 hypothetical protein DFR44_11072 [Hydromonas duriensis]